jgi:hypothetical protein
MPKHVATALTTQPLAHGKVCLFEKRDHLGGRVGPSSASTTRSSIRKPIDGLKFSFGCDRC